MDPWTRTRYPNFVQTRRNPEVSCTGESKSKSANGATIGPGTDAWPHLRELPWATQWISDVATAA